MKNINMKALWPRIVLAVASLIAIIGTFLPWVSLGILGSASAGDNSAIFIIGGIVTLIFAAVAIFVPAKWARITAGVVGIVMSVLMVFNCITVSTGASLFGVSRALGVGYYITLIASIVMFVFSIVTLAKKNPAEAKANGAKK